VASDLPPKIETVLFCEMGAEQRSVYNSVKEKYRNQILQKIDAEGVTKSGFNFRRSFKAAYDL
jgi:non-specific serine/threonine protein kinase